MARVDCLRALRGYGYRCIGFDRQSAAVEFARAQCEKTTADALSAPPPTCCVFQGELTSFASTHTHLVPPASVHMAHCLVSSLKYLPSDAALLQHFAGVATSLVSPGGLYVIAIHLSDYKDTTTSSIDHHTASRNTTTVNATITCEPPNPATRTEPVSIRMTVTQQSTAEEGQDHQEGEEVVRYHCWDEEMRTYDRMELWAILSVLQGDQGWFDVVGMFDYEQARSGKVGAPLAWPQLLQTWSGTKDELEVTQAKPDMDWSEWWGVEAVAVVLKRR